MKNSLHWRHLHDEGELMAGGATTPAHRPATLKLSLARHSEQKPQMKKNFCRIWEGRKYRIQQEDRPANRSEKSSFKSVESDQLQIGPHKRVATAVLSVPPAGSWPSVTPPLPALWPIWRVLIGGPVVQQIRFAPPNHLRSIRVHQCPGEIGK